MGVLKNKMKNNIVISRTKPKSEKDFRKIIIDKNNTSKINFKN